MSTDIRKQVGLLTWRLGVGHIDEVLLRDKFVNSDSRFVEIDGIKVHYRKEGSGEPIILIHGILSSLHTWDAWAAELKKDYTVYRIDLPGFGFSPLPDKSALYTPDNLVRFTGLLLDALGLGAVHIAGNSLGGFVSWNFALRCPERVKTLTVLDPLCYPRKPPLLLKLTSLPLVGFFTSKMIPKWFFDVGTGQVYAQPGRIDPATKQRYFELVLRKGNKKNFLVVARDVGRLLKRADLGDGIKNIKTPTLVMWGEQDSWISPKLAERWRQDLPAAKVITYADCGHVPMEEIPQKTVADLKAFIAAPRMCSSLSMRSR